MRGPLPPHPRNPYSLSRALQGPGEPPPLVPLHGGDLLLPGGQHLVEGVPADGRSVGGERVVSGFHLYSAVLTSGHSKRFTISPNIHPFMHTFTHLTARQEQSG